MKIREWGISARAKACLLNAGYVEVEELEAIGVDELKEIRNLNQSCVDEIVEALEVYFEYDEIDFTEEEDLLDDEIDFTEEILDDDEDVEFDDDEDKEIEDQVSFNLNDILGLGQPLAVQEPQNEMVSKREESEDSSVDKLKSFRSFYNQVKKERDNKIF